MTQDEMEQMLQALSGNVTRQQRMLDHLVDLAAGQQGINDRLTTAIERIDGTIGRLEIILQAIKDMLERGNGH